MSEEKGPDGPEKKADADSQAKDTRTYSDEEFKKVIAERDKAKERLRLIDEDARKKIEAEQLEKGEAKKLLEQKETELAELRKTKESYEKQQATLRDSYINALPDEADRMAAKYIPDIAELKEFVDKKVKPGPPFAAKTQTKEQNLDEVLKPGRSFQEVAADLRKLGLT